MVMYAPYVTPEKKRTQQLESRGDHSTPSLLLFLRRDSVARPGSK